MIKNFLSSILLLTFFFHQLQGQPFPEQEKKIMTDKIRSACQFAWNGYKQYASGYDVLKPISKEPHNWYAHSMLMTPVDAFDTFVLLDMDSARNEAKQMILSQLNFNVDQRVQVFETTIRLLAGLQSAYELDGDKRFLQLAEDLGKRLMPAFKTPTGMPYRFVNLKTGAVKDSLSNPAEVGTLTLEFGKLSQLTGNPAYYAAAKKAALEIFKRRSKIDLVGSTINVITGKWEDTDSHIGGGIDSYYEYLYKASILFNDDDFRQVWSTERAAIEKYLLRKEDSGWYFTHVDMNTGKETYPYYGALDAFYAGTLALSGDDSTAIPVQRGNFYMWTRFNMEPEMFNFEQDTIVYDGYYLRPENIESAFYLYRLTGNDKYQKMGKRMIDNVLTYCKADAGYAALSSVKTLSQVDDMESYFFAETLKYSYLLFAPEDLVDLKKVVFNTEAHPFKIAAH